MSLPVCKFYKNQTCKFGKNCRYLHPSSQRPPPTSSSDQRNQYDEAVSTVTELSADSAPFYPKNTLSDPQGQNEGSVSEVSQQLQASHIEEEPNSQKTSPQSQSRRQEPQTDRVQPNNSQKICVHFARGGNCYYGRGCRFFHALPREHHPRNKQQHQPWRRQQASANAGLVPRFRRKEQDAQDESTAPKEHPSDVSPTAIESKVSDGCDRRPSGRQDGHDRRPSRRQAGQRDFKQESKAREQKSGTQRICPFFKSNRCNRGERCRFRHPPDLLNDLGEDEPEQREAFPAQVAEKGKVSVQRNPRTVVRRDQRSYGPPGLKPILTYSEMEEVGVAKLRQWEISIIQKRFPKDKITVVEDDKSKFTVRIKFTPSDPDWPFDVNLFEILVTVPGSYPDEMLEISLPKDQDLPETVRRYIDVTIGEWLDEKQKQLESKEKVELVFRPFLKWFDRAIEDITTEALKQLKRQLVAKAAGMEFLSPQQLQERFRAKSESSGGEGGQSEEDNEEATSDSEEETDDDDSSEDDDQNERRSNQSLTLDPEKKGTEIELRNLQLREKASAMLFDKLKVVIQCGRCKNHADLIVHQGKVMSMRCGKCNQNQFVNYRAALMHQFSSTAGYLDVDGCQAFDLILQDCRVLVTCLGCSKQTKIEGLVSGQMVDGWCQACNAKFKIATESVKFTQLVPSGIDTTVNKVMEVAPAKARKPPKDHAIREGCPLPEFGTCKHYKHSYRWLRFPCCGKAYPCDVCHDKKEDHEMTLANRMICGHCCKEQNFAATRPCNACGQHLTKIRSAHWEGGAGCRDKITMSRNDQQKYRNLHKTQSNHKKKVQSGGSSKKNTKLRHS